MMYETEEQTQQRIYRQIEESCHRFGISPAEYRHLLEVLYQMPYDQAVEKHAQRISQLERLIKDDIGD